MFLNPLLKWAFGGTLFLSLMLGIALAVERRHSHKLEQRLTACTQGRAEDRARYEQAQKAAAEQNRKEVAEKESRQEKSGADQIRILNDRLGKLRSELRAQAGTAQGTSGEPSAPQVGHPAGTPGTSCLYFTTEELLRGAEDEERHAELVALVEQAMKILNEPGA